MSRTRRKRTIVLRTQDKPKPATRPAPVFALVELEHDGYLRVYGPDNLRVFLFNRLADEDSADLVTLVEEFHTLEIPKPFRPFYDPRRIRATAQVQRRTIEGEARRRWELTLLRALREGAAVLAEGRAAP